VLSHDGTEKTSMQLGQHFMKPPISASNDGFQGIAFPENFLDCANRLNGQVSIFAKFTTDWILKSAWQIPTQAKTAIHLQAGPHNTAVISSLIGQSIGIWDLATQTALVTFASDF
jgi:hypothetical protein